MTHVTIPYQTGTLVTLGDLRFARYQRHGLDPIKIWGSRTSCGRPMCSPWENGCCESFNARFRDELRNGELFYGLKEARILIE